MITLNLSFVHNRKKELDKKGLALVQLRIHFGKTKYVTTGIKIKPTQWDDRRERIKNHPDQINLNLRLTRTKEKIETFYSQSQIDMKSVTIEDLVAFAKGEGKYNKSFVDFVESSIEDNNKLVDNTLKQHRQFLKWLKLYNPNLKFSEINYNTVSKFENWILDQPNTKNPTENLQQNYAALLLTIFKSYCNEAIKNELLVLDPFLDFQIKRERKDMITITKKEFERIAALDLSHRKGRVEEYRDRFLFQCLTGLAFIDSCEILVGDIQESQKGLRLIKKRKKTGIRVDIPLALILDGKPEKLVKRLIEGKDRETSILGNCSLKQYNGYLKEFAELAKIDKKLSSHAGRHTFGTWLVNDGLRLEIVSKLMGHSSVTTTEIYAKMDRSGIEKALEEIYTPQDSEIIKPGPSGQN